MQREAISQNEVDGYKETEIGTIPAEWDVAPVNSFANVSYGKARPKTEGCIPVVGSGGIYAYADESLVDYSTIVVGRKGNAGQAWLFEEPCWPSDTTFYLEWKQDQDVDVRFLHAYMSLNPLSGVHAKTTLPSLQKADLENFLVPFPPIDEQRRIAAVLSTIQQAISAQEQVIQAARELKRSLMHRLFTYGPNAGLAPTKETEIGDIPEHWQLVRLSEAVEFSRKPRGLKLSDFEHIPFFPMELLPEDELVATTFENRTGGQIRSGTYLEKGDFLLAKITPSFENGKQAIVKSIPLPFAYATTEVYAMHPANDSTLNLEYLFHYLKRSSIRTEIAGKMEGSTGRQRVPKAVIENYPFPLAPYSEQESIAFSLKCVQDKINMGRRRINALEALFKSMLHQLMTGQIRVRAADEQQING